MHEIDDGRLRICCLPIAGPENPYQYLMMEGLRECKRLEVIHGAPGKFFAALRTVVRSRPDIIHYDWIFRYFMRRRRWWTWVHAPLFVLEIWIVRYLLNARLTWTMHNMGTHDVPMSSAERWVRRRFAQSCDWIRVFSHDTVSRASAFLNVPESKFIVIPEGSYVGYYPNQVSNCEARDRLGISNDELVILCFGSVRPYKGLDTLIDSFKKRAHCKWRLLIVGKTSSNEYAQLLRDKADGRDEITLHFSFVPDEEVQLFFAGSDVVVLPFVEIENSGSLVLAMGFGKPVIAPDRGVISARLKGQRELLYTGTDVGSGLDKLQTMDRSLLQEIGRENRRRVESHRWSDFARAFC